MSEALNRAVDRLRIIRQQQEREHCPATDLLEPLVQEIFEEADNMCSKKEQKEPKASPVKTALSRSVDRAYETLQQQKRMASTESPSSSSSSNESEGWYAGNPLITTTALAHSLWKDHEIRPGDVLVDATAGNGGDAVQLARLIQNEPTCRLVCIDIQKQACDATREALQSYERTQVVQASHAPLPENLKDQQVGLVVFNLGYLPNSGEKNVQTQVDTTLAALSDACRIVRVGGLLSIMTYPGSNREEHQVVRALVEGLALFSSSLQNWRQVVSDARVEAVLENLVQANGSGQTWRVHEHSKLGWKDAPTFYSALRIK